MATQKKEKSDLPDYEKLRSKYNKIESKKDPKNIWILAASLFFGGILVVSLLPNLGFELPEQVLLIPVYILAFVMLWGFFLPQIIAQELLHTFYVVPESILILSHVIYSYFLAWILIEFEYQIETKGENKKILWITSSLLALILIMVITTLIVLSII